jgi:phosphoribosylanthranilate isomerase
MSVKLKVCGMRQAKNIAEVADLLPDYLGFIFYEKSPRFISDITAELIKYVPAAIKTTGVFVNEDIDVVKEKISKFNLKAVQLHGNEDGEYAKSLKNTGVEVIKAFGIDESFDFAKLNAFQEAADYFLFDTQTPAHGGSGKTFNWKLLANYKLNKPYFLSGGIDLEHAAVIKKITDPRLYAIDINSRFEIEPGLKNVEKLKEFKNNIH